MVEELLYKQGNDWKDWQSNFLVKEWASYAIEVPHLFVGQVGVLIPRLMRKNITALESLFL